MAENIPERSMSGNTPERLSASEYFEEHSDLDDFPVLFRYYRQHQESVIGQPGMVKFTRWLEETPTEELLEIIKETKPGTEEA